VAEERIGLDGGFDFGLVGLDFFGGPEAEFGVGRGGFGRGARMDTRGARPTHFFAECGVALGEFETLFRNPLALEVHILLVITVIGAGGEVGQTLKGEEIAGSVVAGHREVVGGVKNRLVDLVGHATHVVT
jgi:hypothetical protein